MQRRNRDRLRSASKRRSTATCSSRDKEMDGVALECVLQSFLTNRLSRRRSGRPSSSHGSPTGGSPKNGSLSEITSQGNSPPGNQKRGASYKVTEIGKKEWDSECELTENSPQTNQQSNNEDNKGQCTLLNDEMKTPGEEDSSSLPPPVNRIASISSSGRPFSPTAENDDELQDNNEEEAQKLREASRKVLRFQNSRGSVSSVDMETQKPPCAKTVLPRQRTFDEETQMDPGDSTNEDLVKFLFGSQTSSKRNLGRRNTLPSKAHKSEEEQNSQWVQPPFKTANSAAGEKKETLLGDDAGQNPSSQVSDFISVSNIFKKSDSQEQNSSSAERTTNPNVCATHVPDEGLGHQNQEGKSMEPLANHLDRNSGNISNRNPWIKIETSGFFSLLKRLGDISKLQSSKETAQKDSDTGQ